MPMLLVGRIRFVWLDLKADLTRLTILFLVLFVSTARAGQLYLHTISFHVPHYEAADETNWGLAYRWDAGPRLGVFENSYGIRCWYAAWVFRKDGYIHPWLGAIRGYSFNGDHLDDDSIGIGSKESAIIPLAALEVDATKWLRDRHWWPKKVPDVGLVMIPWVVNLEVQF